jgi:hypothetical protein
MDEGAVEADHPDRRSAGFLTGKPDRMAGLSFFPPGLTSAPNQLDSRGRSGKSFGKSPIRFQPSPSSTASTSRSLK